MNGLRFCRATFVLSMVTMLAARAHGQEPAETIAKDISLERFAYEVLVAEVAGQQGDARLSAQVYVEIAKRTRDPRIALRATEIALYAHMNNAAIDAARIWHETEPGTVRPLQALGGLLVSAGRYDEALPKLKELLANSATTPASSFPQLTRSLATAQDKQAALKLVQSLAADYPKLPQARLAVAQAALGAGERELALQEVRHALSLWPGWDVASKLETEILRR
jgi:Flp pilus assembly protein TadD